MADRPRPDGDDDELARMRAAGRMIAPFLTVHVATTLAAARYMELPKVFGDVQAWRERVLKESAQDALILLKAVGLG